MSLLVHAVALQFKHRRTAKELITELVQKQPDDSSYDEIIRELTFHLMIERGLKDSDEGRAISNEEMQARINTWL
jgi:predicted transcriptional regulator